MKKIKMFAAVLAAVTALALLPDANAATATAAGPVTYAVKFTASDGWRSQANTSTFNDDDRGRELYYLHQDLKDGDLVVVYNDITDGYVPELDLGSVSLSNLTYANGTTWAVVNVGSVQDCYVLGGAAGTINANVTNAYVYDTVTFNFNKDVTNLTIITPNGEVCSNIGCLGTVEHLYAYCKDTPNAKPFYDLYSFKKGTLSLEGGTLTTAAGNYVLPENYTPTSAAATTTATTASKSDEYDDVPKTGHSNLYLWLLCASVACFAGGGLLRRSSR